MESKSALNSSSWAPTSQAKKSRWQSFLDRFRRKGHTFEAPERVLHINDAAKNDEHHFPGNKIRTTKYTPWNFLPKNLFEQFHRYANIYFLFIAVLNQMPFIVVFSRFLAFMPIAFVLTVTAIKDAYEDYRRRRADYTVNHHTCEVLPRDGEPQTVLWKDLKVGDVVRLKDQEVIPADILLLACSDEHGVAHIATANLDGETNLKQRMVVNCLSLQATQPNAMQGKIVCDNPHCDIYAFSGQLWPESNTDPVPIDSKNLLLRGCTVRNTAWAVGIIVYAGHDTKAMLNNSGARSKRSKLERDINFEILFVALLMLIMSATCAIGAGLWVKNRLHQDAPYLPYEDTTNLALTGWVSFWTNVVLFAVMVPISLYVSLEMIKLGQVVVMSADRRMYDEKKKVGLLCRALNINEDLGQIEYVFSDKTGTLTENQMIFRQCGVDGKVYGSVKAGPGEDSDKLWLDLELSEAVARCEQGSTLDEFFLMLAVCNTVIPRCEEGGEMTYEAESPDEAALVDAAAEYGYKLKMRSGKKVVVEVNGKERAFTLLALLEFSSDRKRMSTLLRREDGSVVLYTKGADAVIYQRLDEKSVEAVQGPTSKELLDFSTAGLRTLCLAKRELPPSVYDGWLDQYNAASLELMDRKAKIGSVADLIERELTLLGVTGIEDRLQDGVPETISVLKEAGMKVWVLTGDKQETAVNIAYAAKLIDEDTVQILINTSDPEECLRQLRSGEEMIAGMESNRAMSFGLIIDGPTLAHALTDEIAKNFVDLAVKCNSVLCCRTSPLQKAVVVQRVKEYKKVMALGIGDGANDVSMLQCADVGVGISGNEGMQAVMASDFAIARFRFLRDLLLVHGHWCYHRAANSVLYFFYKNCTFVFVLLWFQFYCGFSTQNVINQWYLLTYNLLFTAAPIIFFAILDKDVSRTGLLRYPQLYYVGRESRTYNTFNFWCVMATAVCHSLTLFYVNYLGYYASDIGLWEMGTTVVNSSILVVTGYLVLNTHNMTVVNIFFIVGSMLLFFLYQYVITFMGMEIHGVSLDVSRDPRHWFLTMLAITICLMPVLAFFTFKRLLFPTPVDIVREMRLKESKAYGSGGKGTLLTSPSGGEAAATVSTATSGGSRAMDIEMVGVKGALTPPQRAAVVNHASQA